jgi:hypothetical protein
MRRQIESFMAANASSAVTPFAPPRADSSGVVVQMPQPASDTPPVTSGAVTDQRTPSRSASSRLAVPDTHVVLPATWFRFIVHWSLRQALRQANYLSLVTIRANREYVGLSVEVAAQSLTELADVVAPLIRESDLMGELDDGQLGLLLLQADDAAAFRVIQRFGEMLGDVRFSVALGFAIGTACCPHNGIDMHGLVAHALSHPVLNVRAPRTALDDPPLLTTH